MFGIGRKKTTQDYLNDIHLDQAQRTARHATEQAEQLQRINNRADSQIQHEQSVSMMMVVALKKERDLTAQLRQEIDFLKRNNAILKENGVIKDAAKEGYRKQLECARQYLPKDADYYKVTAKYKDGRDKTLGRQWFETGFDMFAKRNGIARPWERRVN